MVSSLSAIILRLPWRNEKRVQRDTQLLRRDSKPCQTLCQMTTIGDGEAKLTGLQVCIGVLVELTSNKHVFANLNENVLMVVCRLPSSHQDQGTSRCRQYHPVSHNCSITQDPSIFGIHLPPKHHTPWHTLPRATSVDRTRLHT